LEKVFPWSPDCHPLILRSRVFVCSLLFFRWGWSGAGFFSGGFRLFFFFFFFFFFVFLSFSVGTIWFQFSNIMPRLLMGRVPCRYRGCLDWFFSGGCPVTRSWVFLRFVVVFFSSLFPSSHPCLDRLPPHVSWPCLAGTAVFRVFPLSRRPAG